MALVVLLLTDRTLGTPDAEAAAACTGSAVVLACRVLIGRRRADVLSREATTAPYDRRSSNDAALLIGIEQALTAADAALTRRTLTPVQHELAWHRAWDLLDHSRTAV